MHDENVRCSRQTRVNFETPRPTKLVLSQKSKHVLLELEIHTLCEQIIGPNIAFGATTTIVWKRPISKLLECAKSCLHEAKNQTESSLPFENFSSSLAEKDALTHDGTLTGLTANRRSLVLRSLLFNVPLPYSCAKRLFPMSRSRLLAIASWQWGLRSFQEDVDDKKLVSVKRNALKPACNSVTCESFITRQQ